MFVFVMFVILKVDLINVQCVGKKLKKPKKLE